jgi:hypothetical protein
LEIALFWIVRLSLSLPVPEEVRDVPPTKMPKEVAAELLPAAILQFLMTSFVAPRFDPRLVTQTAAVAAAVEALDMVRLRSVPPEFDPSIITQSAPFRLMMQEVDVPLMVATLPAAGRIVSVLVEFANALALMVIGNVSEDE